MNVKGTTMQRTPFWLTPVAVLFACSPVADVPSTNDFLAVSATGTTGGGLMPTSGSTGSEVGAAIGGTTAPGAPTTGAQGVTGTAGGTDPQIGGINGSGTTGVTGGMDPLDGGGTGSGGIAGTYMGCASNTPQSATNCAGYYCGVSEADIAANLIPGSGPCSDQSATRVCAGQLSTTTASCARSVKSNPLNLADDDAALRAKMEACIFEDADLQANVSSACVSCFLDAAQCASDNCLGACLAGDSPECDGCRLDNGCNQTVPPCGGLPNTY